MGLDLENLHFKVADAEMRKKNSDPCFGGDLLPRGGPKPLETGGPEHRRRMRDNQQRNDTQGRRRCLSPELEVIFEDAGNKKLDGDKFESKKLLAETNICTTANMRRVRLLHPCKMA